MPPPYGATLFKSAPRDKSRSFPKAEGFSARGGSAFGGNPQGVSQFASWPSGAPAQERVASANERYGAAPLAMVTSTCAMSSGAVP